MSTVKMKNPDAPATDRQTFALWCATGLDWRRARDLGKLSKGAAGNYLTRYNEMKSAGKGKPEISQLGKTELQALLEG